MPDPAKFKGEGAKKRFMEKCIHQTLHVERKKKDQGIAQCMNQWRQKKHKMASIVAQNYLSEI